jgi:hypothetical protein
MRLMSRFSTPRQTASEADPMTPYTYTVKIVGPDGKQYRFGNSMRPLWVADDATVGLEVMSAALAAAEREVGPGCKIPHEDKYAVQWHRASDYGAR